VSLMLIHRNIFGACFCDHVPVSTSPNGWCFLCRGAYASGLRQLLHSLLQWLMLQTVNNEPVVVQISEDIELLTIMYFCVISILETLSIFVKGPFRSILFYLHSLFEWITFWYCYWLIILHSCILISRMKQRYALQILQYKFRSTDLLTCLWISTQVSFCMEHVEGLRLVLRVYLHLIYLFHINSQASEYPFLPRRIKEALSEKY
jgi:hypothetical protein